MFYYGIDIAQYWYKATDGMTLLRSMPLANSREDYEKQLALFQ